MKKSYCLIKAIVFLIVMCPQKVVSQSPAVEWTLLRNRKIYQSAIAPDVALESVDKFNDIRADEKIKVAIEWIHKQTIAK
ncbi:MAG TPA: hypothetical protein VK616_10955 [Flavitalea sp.]|nr:hypothetical protein [Flavitalea sp.]HTF28954.1 hypothetical protein [Flavitalea sp.]